MKILKNGKIKIPDKLIKKYRLDNEVQVEDIGDGIKISPKDWSKILEERIFGRFKISEHLSDEEIKSIVEEMYEERGRRKR